MRALALGCASVLLAGCFAVADVDRFEKRQDFAAHLIGFEEFAGQRVIVELIDHSDVADLVVAARAVIEPMDADGDHAFVMPLAILEGVEYGADTFVDTDGNGQYSLGEPLWRSTLESNYKLHLERTFPEQMFLDPPTRSVGTDFEMALRGMSPHVADTQYFELLVFDTTDGRPVGYFFMPDVDNQDFDVAIPDIIVSGHDYDVDYYADANMTNCYEDPSNNTDHTWREVGTGGSGDPGLRIEFIHHAMFDRILESFPDIRDCDR